MVLAHQEFIVSLESPDLKGQVSSSTDQTADEAPRGECAVSWVQADGGELDGCWRGQGKGQPW